MKEMPEQYEINFDNEKNKPENNFSVSSEIVEIKDSFDNEITNKNIELSEEDIIKMKDESPVEYYALMEEIAKQKENKNNKKMNEFATYMEQQKIEELKKSISKVFDFNNLNIEQIDKEDDQDDKTGGYKHFAKIAQEKKEEIRNKRISIEDENTKKVSKGIFLKKTLIGIFRRDKLR
jgi:hypothetical protein